MVLYLFRNNELGLGNADSDCDIIKIGWILRVECDDDGTYLLDIKDAKSGGIHYFLVAEQSMPYSFNRIGQYDFTKLKLKHVEKLPVDLVARFEIPDGRYITTKTWDNDGKFVETSYSRELIDKINELVEAVNLLEEKVNE